MVCESSRGYMEAIEVAGSGTRCLTGLLTAEGRFKYRYDSRSGVVLAGYNALRHAGAVWSMLDVYRDLPETQILSGARRAVHFLLDSYLRFFRECGNVCICEENKIKLGGNALAILALVSLFEFTGERFLVVLAEQLANFMLSQRTASGGLVHKRYFTSGKIADFSSQYYTGEALLALLTLYRVTGESRWLEAVREIEAGLAADNYGVAEQSHWMLYTLERLIAFDASPVYYRHAAQIAGHILDNPGYLHWQRSTPIACRSEGLLAFLRIPAPDGVDDGIIRRRCLDQLELNLQVQRSFRLPDGSFVRGGGDRRTHEVRIDYIQHNISSFLHYARLHPRR